VRDSKSHPPPLTKLRRTNKNKITRLTKTISGQEIKSENHSMKKGRKKQEDRLLKHLSFRDRQRQMRLRQQIVEEGLFLLV
jgi:hypothetical protein